MTLIEVLIASIILFIAVSSLSFVTRTSSLHDLRLDKTIDRALLAEFIKDEVAYQFQYENNLKGVYQINNQKYNWQVTVLSEREPLRAISAESGSEGQINPGTVILYEINITRDNVENKLLSVKDVYWKS